MHIDLNDILAAAAPVIQTGSTLLISAAAATGVKLIHEQTAKIKSERMRHYAEILVASVEQQLGKAVSNDQKREQVLAGLRKRFPKVPDEVLRAMLESAVRGLKPTVVPVLPVTPVPPPTP